MGEKNLLKQDSSIEEKELNPISGWIALFIGILFIFIIVRFLISQKNNIDSKTEIIIYMIIHLFFYL